MKKILLTSCFPEAHLKLFHGSFNILLCLLLFSSCSKILEEKPYSLAVETFYNTSEELQTAVNSIYVPLRSTSVNTYGVGINSAHSDYALGRGSWAGLNDFQGLNSTWITRVTEVWSGYYLSIRNANIVIANASKGNSIAQADITKYVAEARFLRAYTYFQLVRQWGGVPLRTESNIKDIACKKSTPDEIYNFLISELKAVETDLPDAATNTGRPTKWAAKTLLADVYLQANKFAEARDKADEVIKSGKYSLVSVTTADDFQKIFGANVVTTTEEIFYFKYSHDAGQGIQWPGLLNHPGTKLYGGGGVYGVHSDSSNVVYKTWNNNDLRKGLWYFWNVGLGTGTILSKKYIDPTALALNAGGNPETCYRYAEVLLIYAEAASRAGSGPTTTAIEALNQVHRRAFGYNPTSTSIVDFKLADYNATTFLDLIIKEFGYEFQCEGKRWMELKRTGKLAEIILAVKGKVVTQPDYLWPIPIQELTTNTALDPAKDQNPGY